VAAPAPEDWAAAADMLRAERHAGEPIVFAPDWVAPLGRHHTGDLLTLDLLTLSDVDRFGRVWQLSVRGADHRWLTGLSAVRTRSFGPVTVSLYEKPPAEVLFDFTARLREARVSRIGDRVRQCPRQDDRFVCDPRQRWNHVSQHLAEVGHRPYRSIYAHPVEGRVMRVAFPAVPLGAELVGYTGISDFENRKRADAPVKLDIYIGAKRVSSVLHQNHWDWRRFEIDTRSYAGQTHPVRFEITAPEGAYARTFCFAAEARE
jgi:hypothetical protein